jgi:hypothetical protein
MQNARETSFAGVLHRDLNGMRKATIRFMKRSFVLLCLTSLVVSPSVKSDIPDLKEVPATLTIYVPVRNTKLERRKVRGKLYNFMPTAITTYASVVAQKALPLMFKKAPLSFPKGTRLTKFPNIKNEGIGKEVMHVSLSKEFLQRVFGTTSARPYLRFTP